MEGRQDEVAGDTAVGGLDGRLVDEEIDQRPAIRVDEVRVEAMAPASGAADQAADVSRQEELQVRQGVRSAKAQDRLVKEVGSQETKSRHQEEGDRSGSSGSADTHATTVAQSLLSHREFVRKLLHTSHRIIHEMHGMHERRVQVVKGNK